MVKKAISCLFVLLFVLSGVFAASTQSLVGTWTYKDDSCKYTKIFTKDGIYVFEEDDDFGTYYYFGNYTVNGNTIETEYEDLDFSFNQSKLIIDDIEYKKTSSRAINSSSKIAGVWTNDGYILGLAKDGLAISQGLYMNIGQYSISNNEITIDDNVSPYVVVNDCLYIEDFEFLDCYQTIKLQREKSSFGTNKTSKTNLVDKGPWFYQNSNAIDMSGVSYTFKSNGTFKGERYVNDNKTDEFKGTYTFENNRIKLDNGSLLTFAIIDDIPIGYSFY